MKNFLLAILWMGRKRLRAVPVAAVAAVLVLFGFVGSPQMRAQSQATGTPSPSFEVASVKPNRSGDGRFLIGGPGSSSGRFIATNIPIRILIGWAYGLKDFQLSGGPAWIGSERVDVDAKVEDSVIATLQKLPRDQQGEQTRLMLQSLLAERFKLALSRSTKELPIYALVVAKDGPKLAATKLAPYPAGVNPGAPPSGHTMQTGLGQITATGEPITNLVDALSRLPEIERIVLDQTGLTGYYDFLPEVDAGRLNAGRRRQRPRTR